MKKLRSIKVIAILLIAIMGLSINAEAGWTTQQRNKCRWYSKRFKALSRISIGAPICLKSGGDCGYVSTKCDKNCGYQEAKAGWSGLSAYGYITQNICARGEVISALQSTLLNEYSNNDGDNKIEESIVNLKNIKFDNRNHKVYLSEFSGKIELNRNSGYKSNVELLVWNPSDDDINEKDDETIDKDEILWSLTIEINEDEVLINGKKVDNSNLIKTEINSETILVEFNNLGFSIDIDETLDMENITVVLQGDGAPNDTKNIEKAIKKTENNILNEHIKFDCYPNPANNKVNVNFSAFNVDNSDEIRIEIYDYTGKKIRALYNGNIVNGAINKNFDITELNKGIYFITFATSNETYLKKLIKQ